MPGEFTMGADAWILCMPGYRNSEPRFKPADEVTAARVAAEMAARQPVFDHTRKYLQEQIDGFAERGVLAIDPATGFFQRKPDGTLAGTFTPLQEHIVETAAGYGLKPAAPAI